VKVYKSIDDYVSVYKDSGYTAPIYTTCGGFDPLHIGHLRCIIETTELAKKNSGYTVIIVNGDGFLTRKKGKPFMCEDERAEIIAGIRGVDAVVIWDDGSQNCIGAIDKLKPAFFTKGGDRAKPSDIAEWDICQKIGCQVLFNVGGGKVQSSSWLTGKSGDQNE